ncbi:hypothetical protein J3T91_05690 [Bifidobacterium sp. B4001]|uniref:hypothetical protein n=1 Tax=unclassified Bifidobacterium TaxID=2608897 RepID=UPI00226B9D69|nr:MULTISPECIES: hypothetical protein [unclassified Bifidobacterium]MCX8673005.1 hypothetical protein [Bifidobacterium sp. B4079]MCX8681438.1 hypothetical protein [Bifidobacterium sp. B4001]
MTDLTTPSIPTGITPRDGSGTTAPTISDLQDYMNNNPGNVRKHGTMIFAIADYSTVAPDKFFGDDGLPCSLPAGYKQMGYVTTKGVVEKRSVKTDDTTMLQDLEPVRSDLSSSTRQIDVTFGEANAYTQALRAGLPVSAWPESKDSKAWSYTEKGMSQLPLYRIYLLTQDGVGADAVYRVEFAYKVTISGFGDRTLDRADTEDIGFTFDVLTDEKSGKQYDKASSVRKTA